MSTDGKRRRGRLGGRSEEGRVRGVGGMIGIGVETGTEEGMTGTAIAIGVENRVRFKHDRPGRLQSQHCYMQMGLA
jgi:hypothetical protein